jgi:hypothetical protein
VGEGRVPGRDCGEGNAKAGAVGSGDGTIIACVGSAKGVAGLERVEAEEGPVKAVAELGKAVAELGER